MMDLKRKQRPKKRKTRRNLDELRKRSRNELKNVDPLRKGTMKLENIEKYQITSNRLTLPYFNKAITSKIITRLPLAKIDTKEEDYKMKNNEPVCNVLSTSNQYQRNDEICTGRITTTSQKKRNMEIGKKYENSKNYVCETKVSESEESQSLLEQEVENSSFEETSNNFNYMHRSHSFRSSSEQELNHCLYKEFMKALPGYFKEYFPTINCIQDQCFGNECQDNGGTGLKCIANKPHVVNPENQRESIIENPMDYIQTACSRTRTMQQKQSILLSSSSSSSVSSHLASNSTDIFLNSPEYQYFPHKLNQ